MSADVLRPPVERTATAALLAELAQRAAERLRLVLDVAISAASDGNLSAAAGAAVLDGLSAAVGGEHATGRANRHSGDAATSGACIAARARARHNPVRAVPAG